MAARKKGTLILAIGSVPLIMTLGNSMLIPILQPMQNELGISEFQASLTITVFSISAAIFIPILGYLSDRFTRKIIILPALILYGIGGLIAGLSAIWLDNAFVWILIGRILQGIGAAGTAPIAMALTGDLFKGGERSRVLGIVEASNGMGKVLSPILGSLLGLLVWYAVFFGFPLICLISIVLVSIFVKEKKKRQSPPPFRKYARGLFSVFKYEGRWLLVSYLAGATCLFTLFGILFYLSEVLEKDYSIDGVVKGLILAIPLLIMGLTSYITGSKIGKNMVLMKRLIFLGLLFMSISYGVLVFIEGIVLFLIVLSLSSIGTGLVLPCINSLITGSVGKERRGFVTSIYGSVRFLGVAIGPPIFSRLMEWSKPGMFISLAIFTLLVGLLSLLLIHVKNKDGKDDEKTPFRYNFV